MSEWFNIGLATIVALLPITNPVSTAALFLSITAENSNQERRQQAFKASVYAFAILLAFLITGTLIMEFFGISIPGLRIAGGVMVIRVAFSMLKAENEEVKPDEKREAKRKEDVSFTPLAMPSLSGPGAIAVTIGLAAGTERYIDFTAIILGIFIVVLAAYLTLSAAGKILKVLGKMGINALSKIMGFLLLAVGIQFLINGFKAIVVDTEFMSLILESIQKVS
jgi:multiple antibiotic resistance protein